MPDPRIFDIPAANDTFATVGAVSTLVLAANPYRQDTEFVNDSEQVIYLARGNPAVIGSGIRLNSGGGSYTIGLYNILKFMTLVFRRAYGLHIRYNYR